MFMQRRTKFNCKNFIPYCELLAVLIGMITKHVSFGDAETSIFLNLWARSPES